MEHVDSVDLLAFFTLPNRILHARVANHLFEGCNDCHERAKEALGLTGDPRVGTASLAQSVFLREAALIKDERRKAPVSWAGIARLEEQERLKAMSARWRFKKYGLALYVLDEAETLAGKGNRDRAKEMVRFSAAVTKHLPARVYGGPAIASLKLRQETVLCNILRMEFDFVRALETLSRADRIKVEEVDPAEEARFFRVKAALLFDLGAFEEGAGAARESRLLYDEMRDLHSKGRALLQEAMILAQFDPESGLVRANQGLDILNPADCYPFVTGVYNKALCLIQIGRAEEAHDFLDAHREIIRTVSDSGAELSFRALDGLILKSRGQIKDAEVVFSYLALQFREERMYREMILSHLERIRIKVETGRWKSAINIATRLTPELARLGLRNDLLAMWASLQDALFQRRNTVLEIEGLIRRRWYAPSTSRAIGL